MANEPGRLLVLVSTTVNSSSAALLPASCCLVLPQELGTLRFSPPVGKKVMPGGHPLLVCAHAAQQDRCTGG